MAAIDLENITITQIERLVKKIPAAYGCYKDKIEDVESV